MQVRICHKCLLVLVVDWMNVLPQRSMSVQLQMHIAVCRIRYDQAKCQMNLGWLSSMALWRLWEMYIVCVCVCVLYKRFLHINNLNTIAGRLQRSGWLQDNWRWVKAWHPGKHQRMNRMVYIEMFINPILGIWYWALTQLPIASPLLAVDCWATPWQFLLGKSAEDRANCWATMPCGGFACGIHFHHPRHGIARGQESHDCLKQRPWWALCECRLDWTSVDTTAGHKARYAMTPIAMWTKICKQW